ncbi:hypothetical protein DY124_07585 [Apilactobacillus micheneri]|nr:hypothetical protein DY124_07585 [Apilactobacillus micheneri]
MENTYFYISKITNIIIILKIVITELKKTINFMFLFNKKPLHMKVNKYIKTKGITKLLLIYLLIIIKNSINIKHMFLLYEYLI